MTQERPTTANVEKMFASLGYSPAAQRIFMLNLKETDTTGNGINELDAQGMIDKKIYSSERPSNAIRNLQNSMGKLSRLKVNRTDYFFTEIKRTPQACTLHINPKLDYAEITRGFRALPMSVFEAEATTQTIEKSRAIIFAVYIDAKNHLEELRKKGRFTISLKRIQQITNWTPYTGKKQAKKFLEASISKAFNIKSGLSIYRSYYTNESEQKNFKKYLEESFLEIQFDLDVLKVFLGAFGMEPAVQLEQPKPEPITIPFETAKEETLDEYVNHPEVVMDTLNVLDLLDFETRKGKHSLTWLAYYAITNSITDIKRWKDTLSEACTNIANILKKLEFCCVDQYGEEIKKGWEDILNCKSGKDYESQLAERVEYLGSRYPSTLVWNIIKDFVLRLYQISLYGKRGNTLGELGKVNCVRFWLKEEQMNWSIEELEEIIAGLEGNSRKVAQA